MFWNPYGIAALVLGGACYLLGLHAFAKNPSQRAHWGMGLLIILLTLPALSFDLYYTHLVNTPGWYLAFRSVVGVELLSACWGTLFGFVTAGVVAKANTQVTRTACHTFSLICALLCIAVPFLKPVIDPVEALRPLNNRWKGNVCLQSSGATCGPASLATIFAYYGIHHSEREIARAAYSSSTGTELWYLIRYARLHGLRVRGLQPHRLADVPVPALLGTTAIPGVGPVRSGHFITLLGKSPDGYAIADPENGCRRLSEQEFFNIYGRLVDGIAFSTKE